jgi:diacylglycerol kinase (ATP)
MAQIKWIHVIVNPASGQDRPILGPLNRAFQPAGIRWEVKITQEAGDACRFAQEAVAQGVDAVAAYGGDGTIMEVASGLIGSQVPMAIFPGGTANVMSVELGIPNDLAQACALVSSEERALRQVDMGQINKRTFLLRAGVGFEADLVQGASRELKDRIGNLAYVVSALQALTNARPSHYQLTLDGTEIEIDGITCMIANSGNLGQPGLSLAPSINVDDGLLDVIVIRAGDIVSMLSLIASVVGKNENAEPLQHYQAREVKVRTETPQTVQADGEILGETPVSARVLPQAVTVIVPKPANGMGQ